MTDHELLLFLLDEMERGTEWVREAQQFQDWGLLENAEISFRRAEYLGRVLQGRLREREKMASQGVGNDPVLIVEFTDL